MAKADLPKTEEGLPDETNRTHKMRKRTDDLSCSYCRPNKGENAKRKPRHGVKKPRKKNHD